MGEMGTILIGGMAGGVFGCITALLSTYIGPRKLEEWKYKRDEERIHGPRKHLLLQLLKDEKYDWRYITTLARTTGMKQDECRRLLIEIGTRGSLGDEPEKWALVSRQPIDKQ